MVVELVGGKVAEGLVRTDGLIDVIPGEKGMLQAVEVSGQFLNVIELVVVGAEGAFDPAVTLRVVGPVEVVSELEFTDGLGEFAQELAATVRLNRLYGEGEAGDDLAQGSGLLGGW